ncbi:hypothetical protein KP509_31G060300 [Ceratopteris richardii]|uniref:Uncharacterized protein n=1 Tax=Ceratopteris richardii TaxID=49495 RepID=A0A8T2QZT2_CERRI|nr:hypothetical protein KP509_31G060300 [Ceratopteris richardii]
MGHFFKFAPFFSIPDLSISFPRREWLHFFHGYSENMWPGEGSLADFGDASDDLRMIGSALQHVLTEGAISASAVGALPPTPSCTATCSGVMTNCSSSSLRSVEDLKSQNHMFEIPESSPLSLDVLLEEDELQEFLDEVLSIDWEETSFQEQILLHEEDFSDKINKERSKREALQEG